MVWFLEEFYEYCSPELARITSNYFRLPVIALIYVRNGILFSFKVN